MRRLFRTRANAPTHAQEQPPRAFPSFHFHQSATVFLDKTCVRSQLHMSPRYQLSQVGQSTTHSASPRAPMSTCINNKLSSTAVQTALINPTRRRAPHGPQINFGSGPPWMTMQQWSTTSVHPSKETIKRCCERSSIPRSTT